MLDIDWRTQVERHSLGWVCAFDDDRLVGFVNVAWDGGVHAFVIDTLVAADRRHAGIGRKLLEVAERESRRAGCEWLHVDFEDALRRLLLRCLRLHAHAGRGDRPALIGYDPAASNARNASALSSTGFSSLQDEVEAVRRHPG